MQREIKDVISILTMATQNEYKGYMSFCLWTKMAYNPCIYFLKCSRI